MKRYIPKFVLNRELEKSSREVVVSSRSIKHRFRPGDILSIYRGGTRKELMNVVKVWCRSSVGGYGHFNLIVVRGLFKYCTKRWPAGTVVTLIGNVSEGV